MILHNHEHINHNSMEFLHTNASPQDHISKPDYSNNAYILPIVRDTGEVLNDKGIDWQDEKLRSLAISNAINIDIRKQRIFDCSRELVFSAEKSTGRKKLITADFCKDRMCPACQRRRSLKVFHQIKTICSYVMSERPTTCFMLLTLTVPNVHKDNLPSTISHMMKSFARLFKKPQVKKAVVGWFRSLEITKEKTVRQDHYHPHFHVLIAVNSNYFTKNYIKQSSWLDLWRASTKQPEITQVDIRRIRPNKKQTLLGATSTNDQGGSSSYSIAAAAAEVGKYATKPSDYLQKSANNNYYADPNTVNTLAGSLHGTRLIAFGLLLKQVKELLALEDAESENVDLINTGNDLETIDAVMLQVFKWNSFNGLYIN